MRRTYNANKKLLSCKHWIRVLKLQLIIKMFVAVVVCLFLFLPSKMIR